MLLPKIIGPEVLNRLKKDPETMSIAAVVFTGLSPKNALRVLKDGAFGFSKNHNLGWTKAARPGRPSSPRSC